MNSSRAICVRVNFPFILSRIQTVWWMHPCGHRSARLRIRVHACTRVAFAYGYLCRMGKRRRTERLKKGTICRVTSGTPCAWECQWGYVYTRHSPFPIYFLLRVGFFNVASSCLRVYDVASSLNPPTSSPTSSPRSSFSVCHPVSCGAWRFLFQIFSVSMKRFVDGSIYEWNGAITLCEVVVYLAAYTMSNDMPRVL